MRILPRSRRRSRAPEPDAHIEGEAAHSWWSERDSIERKPNPKKRGKAASSAPQATSAPSGFEQYNTAESLFGRPALTPADAIAQAFAVLGVAPTANRDEIALAYRTKAKGLHPDIKGGDEAKMMELNQAYAILRTRRLV